MSYYEVMKYRDRERYYTTSTLESYCNLESSEDFLSFTAFRQHVDQCDVNRVDGDAEPPKIHFYELEQDNSQNSDYLDALNRNFGAELPAAISSSSDLEETDSINCISNSLCPLEERSCSRRKQSCPFKSPSSEDPNFRGVIISMTMNLDSNIPNLTMTSSYRSGKVPFYSTRRRRYHTRRNSESTMSHSDSEDESVSYNNWKQCASCNTRKTPLWRDAEDGTPLCNACGIRYKKYHLRCVKCWHVPKKGDKIMSCCSSCGSLFRQNTIKK